MKSKRVIKTILKIAGILLLLIIAAVIAIPYFFKDELITFAEEQLDNKLRAKTTFEDVDISLFRSFPDVAMQINGFNMVGIDEFEGVPLLSAKEISIDLDLMSVIKSSKPYQINGIRIIDPTGNVVVSKSGEPNYDVTGDYSTENNTGENEPLAFELNLDEYEIRNARFDYIDLESGVKLNIDGLDHSGSGNFTQDVYDLTSKTDIKKISLVSEGISYLSNTHIKLDATFNIDMLNQKYTLKDNTLTLNDLLLKLNGFVSVDQEEWSGIRIDMDFAAPDNNFKQLLSLIPGAYTEDFGDVRADGNFSLSGNIDGVYNLETGAPPPFDLSLKVNNGQFQYPDLPVAVSNIDVAGNIENKTSELDDMVVDFSQFDLNIGKHPLESSFRLRKLMSDPDIKARAKGKLDLGEVAQAFPMDGINELKGLVNADLEVETRMSIVESGAYDKIKMRGDMSVRDLIYKQEGLPAVAIANAKADIDPKTIYLSAFDGKIGKSDLRANGQINDALNYFSKTGKITGKLDLQSNYFDVNEWLTEDTATSEAATAYGSGTDAATEEPFNRFDIQYTAIANKVDYDIYELKGVKANGKLSPETITVKDAELTIGKSDFQAYGDITNWWDYVYNNETLGGNLTLKSTYIDAYELSGATAPSTETSSSTATPEPAEPAAIPERISMSINADIDRLTYDNIELRDMKGILVIADQAMRVDGMKAKGLGGDMLISGGYDTKEPQTPSFDFKYDLQNMDFKRSFETFNTFQKMAPIAKYMSGTFNTSMVMSGKLGKDYEPVYSSLSASGFLQTLDAVIKNFKPVKAISDKLGLKSFGGDNVSIRNSKNWFEVKDGNVEFSPADVSVKNIAMQIGGKHSLAGEGMDYNIKAKVPRELLDQNALGSAATSGLDWASGQANKLGLNLGSVDFFNFDIGLSGSLTSPKVKVKLLGTEGGKSVKDAVKDKAETEVKEVVDDAKKKLDEEKDKAEAEARKRAEEARKKAEEEAKRKAAEAKKKLEEEAKKKLEKFNPFGKK